MVIGTGKVTDRTPKDSSIHIHFFFYPTAAKAPSSSFTPRRCFNRKHTSRAGRDGWKAAHRRWYGMARGDCWIMGECVDLVSVLKVPQIRWLAFGSWLAQGGLLIRACIYYAYIHIIYIYIFVCVRTTCKCGIWPCRLISQLCYSHKPLMHEHSYIFFKIWINKALFICTKVGKTRFIWVYLHGDWRYMY